MSKISVDIGEVYDRAKEVAKKAVAGSPRTEYGLEDVMSEDEWVAVGTSAFMSLVPVHATLNGCIEALQDRKVSATDVEKADSLLPRGTAITQEDIGIVRAWLTDSLVANVNEDGRQAMVDREAMNRGWTGDATRVTSLVLALVVIATAAADR